MRCTMPTTAVKRYAARYFNLHTPQPKYDDMWEPRKALRHVRHLYRKNRDLDWDDLMAKTVFLTMIFTNWRVSDLYKIQLDKIVETKRSIKFRVFKPKEWHGAPERLSKEKVIQILGRENKAICPVRAWRRYLRKLHSVVPEPQQLFYNQAGVPLRSATMCNRLVRFMRTLGIPEPYTANSIRHAAATQLIHSGLSVDEAMEHCGWTSRRVCLFYYNKKKLMRESTQQIADRLLTL